MFTALTSGLEMLIGIRPKQENYILFSTCKGVVTCVDGLMKKSKRKNVFISAVARQPRNPRSGEATIRRGPTEHIVLVS